MSTNFSPKSVFGRMIAVAAVGTCSPSLMRSFTRASPSTSWMLRTSPMFTPRTFTSEPGSRPWPAASKLPTSS